MRAEEATVIEHVRRIKQLKKKVPTNAVCDQHQDKMKNDNQRNNPIYNPRNNPRNNPIYKTTAGPPLQELQLSSIDDEMNEDMKLHSFRLMWARRK
jgi:hypothetical protein